MLQVIFEKVSSDAILPTKGSLYSACWDVYAADNYYLSHGTPTVISTKLLIKIPHNYMIRILPRSGMAIKGGVKTMAGVIDSDYRGELKIVLSKIGPHRYFIKRGDRIAQIQLLPVPQWECIEGKVDYDTERADGGFGSTGR